MFDDIAFYSLQTSLSMHFFKKLRKTLKQCISYKPVKGKDGKKEKRSLNQIEGRKRRVEKAE